MSESGGAHRDWPALPYAEWRETKETLHLWTQIVGKIRLAQSPWVNHGWHVTLYVTPRGLTTGKIPHGHRAFSIEFDFLNEELVVQASDRAERALPLREESVAAFYERVTAALSELGLPVKIHTTPNEIEGAIPFEQDRTHASFDSQAATRFAGALLQIDRVFQRFRAGFAGKCSPVHFFWGSFDLAVTRFSGRPAPPHPGGVPNFPDWAAREAYSHEVSSAGFWPGADGVEPLFYCYAYPPPNGFAAAAVRPEAAHWHGELDEFVLPYDAVRTASDPDATLLAFLESTYAAAADLGRWDREALEYRPPPEARQG